VPENGETNPKFGVYRSLCCGAEIVINAGLTFPDCPNHPKLTTIWKPVADEKIIRQGEQKSESFPAAEAHVENRRLFDLASGRLKLEKSEQNHVHGCEVCQGVLYVLVNQPSSAEPRKPNKPADAA
jgi:hypothetical protein